MSVQRSSLSLQREPRGTTNIFDIHRSELEDVTASGDAATGTLQVAFHTSGLKLHTTSPLGKGAFGVVYVAKSQDGDTYALKVSAKELSPSDWERLQEEVTLMCHFSQHPNTVRFFTAGRDASRMFVVMERCLSKTLNDVLARRELSIDEILWVGHQLVTTVQHLHRKGCVHRDLKPANLLFDFQGNLKISDFGLASRVSDERPRKTVAGTMVYMAPEMALHVYNRRAAGGAAGGPPPDLQYGHEVDVWSVGVVLIVMATRANPYIRDRTQPLNQQDMIRAVCQCKWEWPSDWQGDTELKDLVDWMLNAQRSKRPSMEAVVAHSFWRRRPLTCPLSLLSQLGLIHHVDPSTPQRNLIPLDNDSAVGSSSAQRGGGGGRLGSVNNTPAHRIAVDEYFRRALGDVTMEELRVRSRATMEAHEMLAAMWKCWKLLITESQYRADAEELEAVQRTKLCDRIRASATESSAQQGKTKGARAGSTISAMSSTLRPSARVSREGSVMLIDGRHGPRTGSPPETDVTRQGEQPPSHAPGSAAVLVRASTDKLAVYYPGRETATKWSLRPCVSLPRDLTETMETFVCMNKHPLKKLTAMPSGYNGFDCNVCDRAVLTINADNCLYRCAKCDYDVCKRCATGQLFKDVHFVCVTCAKKFPSNAKLQSHMRTCRGPSVAPSPTRESLSNTQLWEELSGRKSSRRLSMLDVQLPSSMDDSLAARRVSTGPTGWSRQQALSDRGLELDTADADEQAFIRPSTLAERRTSQGTRLSSRHSIDSDDVSMLLPENVGRMSKRLREEYAKAPQHVLRASVEIRPPMRRKSHRLEQAADGGAAFHLTEAIRNEPVGIAAQRAESRVREGSVQNVISIRADQAEKLREMARQPTVQKKGSSRQATTESASRVEAPRSARQPNVTQRTETPPSVASHVRSVPPTSQQRGAAGASPSSMLPPRGPHSPSLLAPPAAAPSSTRTSGDVRPPPQEAPAAASKTRAYVTGVPVGPGGHVIPASVSPQPTSTSASTSNGEQMLLPAGIPFNVPPQLRQPSRSGSVAGRGSVGAMPAQVQITVTQARANFHPHHTSPLPRVSASGAYLALPQQGADRRVFMEQFLGGPWVRCYAFGFDNTSIVHYSLQPGRYGAVFANDSGGIGTAVVDIHSKLVLYVPSTNNDSASRTQPHPHVQTFYDEDMRLLTATEANRALPAVLESIMSFVNELTRMQMEGLTTSAVEAAYVHNPTTKTVPRDTKFAYVRKIFPDPQNATVLFRLSNLRSQLVMGSMAMDIRWQSDRQHNVGSKYYIYRDGHAEPFAEDRTGMLQHMQTVIENSYRRQ